MVKNKLIYFISLIFLILSVTLISAEAITDDIHVNIQSTNSSGTVETGTFDFVFNISNNADCAVANVIYTNSSRLATDTRGVISYYLPDVTLDYDLQYWLCYYRYNLDTTLNRSSSFKMARTPYAFNARNVTLSGVEIDTNLEMTGYNVTADSGLFTYLGSLVNRVTKIFAQNVDVSENVSASWFKGRFNFTDDSIYLDFDGSTLSFNQTLLNNTIESLDTSYWTQSGSSIYYNSGYVGVGVINPNTPLHIQNTSGYTELKIQAGDGTSGSTIQFTNFTGTEIAEIYTQGLDDSLRIQTSGDEDRLILTQSGNLGLGTTPSTLLHLNDTGDVELRIQTASSDGNPSVQFYNNTGEAAEIYSSWTDNSLRFQTGGNNDRLTIKNDGKVGIGTATPQNELNVIGDINATGEVYRNNKPLIDWSQATNGTLFLTSQWNATNSSYYLESNPYGYYNSTTLTTNSQLLNGNSYWNDTHATFNKTYADTIYSTIDEPLWTANYTAYNDTWTTTDEEIWTVVDNDTFVPYTNSNANVVLEDYNFSVGTSDLFVDASSGRVGIGTTNPDSLFHINATAIIGGREVLMKGTVSDGGNDAFGIVQGTNADNEFAPAFYGYKDSDNDVYSLDFRGMTSSTRDVSDSSTMGIINFEVMRTSSASDPNNGVLSEIENRKLFTFKNLGTTHLAIQSDGDVILGENGGKMGIGTTTPDQMLDIQGDGSALKIQSADYENVFMGRGATSGAGLDWGKLTLFENGVAKINLLGTGDSYFNGGNVGIGTTTPDAKLHIGHAGDVGGIKMDTLLDLSNGDSSLIEFAENQNVGSSQGVSLLYAGATNPTIGGRAFIVPANSFNIIGNDGATDTIAMTIQRTGNVGINTTTPTNTLNVVGDANVTETMHIGSSQVFTDGGGNMIFRI